MDPITREEQLMAGEQLEPITRKEYFLAKAAGMDVETPEPITREEMFLSMISGGGTGGSGGADWNAKEGEPGYVENRPFWRETHKVRTVPELEMPITVTTESLDGFFLANGELYVVLDTKNYVVYDGVEYECEPYYSEFFESYVIGDEKFVNYPFCIFDGVIITETKGTHTIEQYYEEKKVIANYSPSLVVMADNSDKTPYLNTEDVEKIKNAHKNGIPVWIKAFSGTFITAQVFDVTDSLICAFGCNSYGSNSIMASVFYFNIEDGSLHSEDFSITGSINDNGNYLPVMLINNRRYKITVGDSGNLVATEIT